MPRFVALRIAAVAATVLIAATNGAHALTWSSHGPDGGATGALGIDPSNPSTVYATSRPRSSSIRPIRTSRMP